MDVEALHGTELKRGEDSSRVRTDSGEIAEISQLGLAQRGFRSISILNAESLVSEREKREKEEKRASKIGNGIMCADDISPGRNSDNDGTKFLKQSSVQPLQNLTILLSGKVYPKQIS